MSLKLFRWLALLPAVCLLSACYTPPRPAVTRQIFRESNEATVVLRYYRWDTIFMTRPDYRDNGFLRQLHRDDLARVLTSPDIRKDMAVVVLGHADDSQLRTALIADWRTMLDAGGFRRVVILRAGYKDEIDGLQILHDSGMVGGQ